MKISRVAAKLTVASTLIAGVCVVPSAAAPSSDPLDPSSPGAKDPYPVVDAKRDCGFNFGLPSRNPPDFQPPSGLGDIAPCVILRGNLDTPPRYNDSTVNGVQNAGLQGAPHLAQWVKIPTALSMAVVPLHSLRYQHLLANNTFGPPDPPPGEPANTELALNLYPRVWFLSQDKKRVGEMPPFTVRALAFGAIPVEATIAITQPESGGTVDPLQLTQKVSISSSGFSNGYNQIIRDASGGGEVDVAITSLKLDGVTVDVGERCQTSQPSQLSLSGKGYSFATAGPRRGDHPPTPNPGEYNGNFGGLLTGTIDIPSFSRCASAAGDDVSPILTNAISGADNPIDLSVSLPTIACYPQQAKETCGSGPAAKLSLPDQRPATRPGS